jgi:hypothetical protein
MLSAEFLAALNEAMPAQAELEDYGLEPEEIEAVQASFRSTPRKLPAQTTAGKTELEKLVSEHDCSTVEVGLIRFLPRPRVHHCGMQVAYCEADAVVVGAAGGVAMHDHDEPAKSLKCAANSERFLDALAAFVAMRCQKSQWKGRVEEAAKACATKAGGEEYVPFFRLLCGYLA